MIASWMLYALVITALVSVAALITERIAMLRRLQGRWIWVSALLLSVLLPLVFAWQGGRSSAAAATALLALAAREAPPLYKQSPIAWIGSDTTMVAGHATLDSWLLVGWSAMSTLALVTLSLGWMQLRRRLRSGVAREVNGVGVTITHDVGPAVVGIIRPRIVFPAWLLQADTATQATALAHELEHIRTQDIRVLGSALLLAVLLPWNLPLWWQLRRLRFAMEVDCDARVLRSGQSPSAYSAVLLNVATQLVPLRAAAAGLSESGSSLEKRIRIMHAPVHTRWRVLAGFLGTCSVALIAVAANVTTPPVRSLTAAEFDGGLPLLPTPVATQTDDEATLARAVGYFHPELLQSKQAGRAYVWAVVNERGEVSQIEVTVRPSWDSQEDFDRNWKDYLERAGVTEAQIRQQLVLQVPIGPNYAVVAWVMQPGSVARDATAPTFELAPRQARVMEARMLATVDAQGVPSGQELWFLIDADGKALRAGRRTLITDPEVARLAMQKLFPGISVGYVTRGTAVKDSAGKRIPVSWQWTER